MGQQAEHEVGATPAKSFFFSGARFPHPFMSLVRHLLASAPLVRPQLLGEEPTGGRPILACSIQQRSGAPTARKTPPSFPLGPLGAKSLCVILRRVSQTGGAGG